MGDIKEELLEQLPSKTAFEIPIFGGIPVPQSAVVTWGIMLVLFLLVLWLTHDLKIKPGKKQILVEMFVTFINNFCKENLGGKFGRMFAPYLGTIGLYLVFANLSGLFGVAPPTKDLNVTAGLAIMSVVVIYGSRFVILGMKKGMKKFAEPVAIVTPLNIMEIGIRPLSLCMRLFGNVFAAFVIMELIKCVLPVALPVPFSLYFDIFDGIIQAVVFVFLTTLFLSESLEEE